MATGSGITPSARAAWTVAVMFACAFDKPAARRVFTGDIIMAACPALLNAGFAFMPRFRLRRAFLCASVVLRRAVVISPLEPRLDKELVLGRPRAGVATSTMFVNGMRSSRARRALNAVDLLSSCARGDMATPAMLSSCSVDAEVAALYTPRRSVGTVCEQCTTVGVRYPCEANHAPAPFAPVSTINDLDDRVACRHRMGMSRRLCVRPIRGDDDSDAADAAVFCRTSKCLRLGWCIGLSSTVFLLVVRRKPVVGFEATAPPRVFTG